MLDKVAFSTNLSGFAGQGYKEQDRNKGFYSNSKLYFDLSENQSLNLGFAYFTDDTKSTSAITEAQFKDNPSQKGSQNNAYIIKRPEFSADYSAKFGDLFDLNLAGFWQRQNVEIGEGSGYEAAWFKDTLSGANVKGKLNYFDNSYLILGYDFQRHNSQTLFAAAIMGRVVSDDIKDTHSVFVLDSHKFSDFFTLSGGARYEYAHYDQYSKGSSYELSFKENANNFALELTPTFSYSDTGKIYAKYERGYISPTPYQYRQQRNRVYSLNKDLKSSSFDTAELGLGDYFFGFFGLNLTLYYTLTHDELTRNDAYTHSGPVSSQDSFFYNIDKTTRYGADLNLRQDLGAVSLYENFAFIDAKIASGNYKDKKIPLVSAFKASGGIDYEVFRDFKLFATLTYASKAKEDEANKYNMPDYFLTDLGLSYKIGALSLFAGAKNIFDRHYHLSQTHTEASTRGNMTIPASFTILPADGRSYYAKFSYKF